ncbi:MAG: SurA N-terminal domain-containing protein, partial [Brachymonas sp.]|nr:SurA N-terminal domain-containing protein [Brachymonas sp.]
TFMLMLLVIPAFVFGGLELYQRVAGGYGVGVASVDGNPITQQEWDATHRQQIEQVVAAQPGMNTAMFETPYAKYVTLERMIDERLVAAAAAKYHLSVSDEQLAQTIANIPEVAALKGADGRIDQKKYAELLRANGQTTEAFEKRIREQMTQQTVLQTLSSASGWQPAILTEQVLKPLLERREVQAAVFPASDYIAKIKPVEADLRAWHQQHQADFYTAPEQASVEYLVLDQAAIQKRHPYTEKDLQAWYVSQGKRYGQPETRRARHILILADEKADAATIAAAKQKAEDLLKELKAKPERFEELAKANSQDPGSAVKGGDLGFFDHSMMVKPFADAAFALQKNGISEVVQSRFGFHIIQLLDIKPSSAPPLSAHKAQVEADFQAERFPQFFAEDSKLFTEALAADRSNLKAAADKLGLTVQTSNAVQRQPVPGAQGVLSSGKFLQALFAPESLDKKQVIEPVSLNEHTLVAGRMVNHSPARALPFEEVKEQVSKDYVQAKAADMAKEAGAKQLQQWQAKPEAATLQQAVVVSKMQPGPFPPPVVESAFRADAAKLPAMQGVELGSFGYAIVRVNKVLPPDADSAAMQAQQAPVVLQALTQAQLQAYLDTLRQMFKIKVNVPRPEMPPELVAPRAG